MRSDQHTSKGIRIKKRIVSDDLSSIFRKKLKLAEELNPDSLELDYHQNQSHSTALILYKQPDISASMSENYPRAYLKSIIYPNIFISEPITLPYCYIDDNNIFKLESTESDDVTECARQDMELD